MELLTVDFEHESTDEINIKTIKNNDTLIDTTVNELRNLPENRFMMVAAIIKSLSNEDNKIRIALSSE